MKLKLRVITFLIGICLVFALSSCSSLKKNNQSTFNQSEKLELDESDAPFLKSPKIRKYWQNDRIEGKKFIKGHWIYEIEEQPVWMQQ